MGGVADRPSGKPTMYARATAAIRQCADLWSADKLDIQRRKRWHGDVSTATSSSSARGSAGR
eukprot:1600513-Prymnesium_polylepis.1